MVKKEASSIGSTPRWVKVQAAFVALLILVVVAMLSGLLGGHGHGGSVSSGHQQPMGEH